MTKPQARSRAWDGLSPALPDLPATVPPRLLRHVLSAGRNRTLVRERPAPRPAVVDWTALLSPGSIPRALLGGAVFWFPGLAWAWTLARDLGWRRWVPISIVLAFTVQPLVMFFANLITGLEVTTATTALASVTLGLAGLAAGLRSRVHERLEL